MLLQNDGQYRSVQCIWRKAVRYVYKGWERFCSIVGFDTIQISDWLHISPSEDHEMYIGKDVVLCW
jgi:hypothetical protein